MQVLFDFLLFAGIIFLVMKASQWHRKGKAIQLQDGRSYEQGATLSSSKRHLFYLGITVPSGYRFTLKRATWADRFFNRIGLSSAYRIGREDFDQTVYIVSNDEPLYKRLCANIPAQKVVLDLLSEKDGAEVQVTAINCKDERLWAEFKTDRQPDQEEILAHAERAVPQLFILKELLPPEPNRTEDSYLLKSRMVVAACIGIFLFGIVTTFSSLFSLDTLPFLYDGLKLIEDSLVFSILLCLAFLLTVAWFLRGGAGAHLALKYVLIYTPLGLLLMLGYQMNYLNMALDSQPAVTHTVPIIEANRSSGSRSTSSKKYYVSVKNWHRSTETVTFRVSKQFFDQVQSEKHIHVFEKPGKLGYRWVEKLALPNGATTND